MEYNNTKSNLPVNIAIFASGAGTNALKIINHFSRGEGILIKLIITNNKNAGVITIAKNNKIPVQVISRDDLINERVATLLQSHHISMIVLAGFLLKIPLTLIDLFPEKIINIHPALLPLYGGKGMYGNFVHEAVLKSKDVISGISIHIVDEQYDHGRVLFQASCPVLPNENCTSLASKVHKLEHAYYPGIIELYIAEKTKSPAK